MAALHSFTSLDERAKLASNVVPPVAFAFGDFVLDVSLLELRHKGVVCHLQPKPLDLLLYLVVHRDRVVMREELFARLWRGTRVTENALSQAIACVRSALGPLAVHAITSVRGRGYRFVLPVVERRASGGRPAVLDATRSLEVETAVAELAGTGKNVIRIACKGDAPLETFRALLVKVSSSEIPVGDVDAIAQRTIAVFNDDAMQDVVFLLEHLERADVASLLLFDHLTQSSRKGRAASLHGTYRDGVLEPSSAAHGILARIAERGAVRSA